MYCKKPDKDVPGIICGYSLPCPYHTVTIDLGAKPVSTVTIQATIPKAMNPRILSKLKQIALILKNKE